MKRFFAGLLALLLLIPAVCFAGFSEEADATTATGGGRLPARYGTITADGTAEAAMAYDTPILKDHSGFITLGATWNETTLALGFISEQVVLNSASTAFGTLKSRTNRAIDSVTVTLANGSYTYTANGGLVCTDGAALAAGTVSGANADGYLVELLLPIAAIRAYRNESGEICTAISITVKTGDVTEQFNGYVVFSAEKVTHSSTLAGASDTAIGTTAMHQHAATAKVNEKGLNNQVRNYKTPSQVHELYFYGNAKKLMDEGTPGSLTFDFRFGFAFGNAATVPVSTPKQTEKGVTDYNLNAGFSTTENGMRALIFIGFGLQNIGGWRQWSTSQFVFAVHNTADGLKIYFDDGNSPYGGDGIALNRKAGDNLNLTFAWMPNGDHYDFTVYVDGERAGVISAPKGNAYPLPCGRGCGVAFGSVVDKNTDVDATDESKLGVFTYRNPVICEYVADNEAKAEKLLKDYGILQDNCFQTSAVGADGTYAIRFLTTIEDFLCDAYAEVGFEAVAVQADGTESKPIERRTNKVYSTIMADSETVSAPNGTYWVAVAVNGIPAEAVVTFVIRPFAVTANGEKHYGATGQITLPYTSN